MANTNFTNPNSLIQSSSSGGTVSAEDWIKGIGFSLLASVIGAASKLAIRKSWLIQNATVWSTTTTRTTDDDNDECDVDNHDNPEIDDSTGSTTDDNHHQSGSSNHRNHKNNNNRSCYRWGNDGSPTGTDDALFSSSSIATVTPYSSLLSVKSNRTTTELTGDSIAVIPVHNTGGGAMHSYGYRDNNNTSLHTSTTSASTTVAGVTLQGIQSTAQSDAKTPTGCHHNNKYQSPFQINGEDMVRYSTTRETGTDETTSPALLMMMDQYRDDPTAAAQELQPVPILPDSYLRRQQHRRQQRQFMLLLLPRLLRGGGIIGMTLLNPLCSVLAMNYASPSILAPFSGLTLVWIILFSYPVLREKPTMNEMIACSFILLGEVIVAIFGDHTNDEGLTVQDVKLSYQRMGFLFYCLGLTFWMLLLLRWMRNHTNTVSPTLQRFSWGVSGGSITGMQNFLKDALTVLKASSSSPKHTIGPIPVPPVLFLILFLGAVLTASAGLVLLTFCMKRYDATYSASMFVGSFVVSASIMSALKYDTFQNLRHIQDLIMYPTGLGLLMMGVFLLAHDDGTGIHHHQNHANRTRENNETHRRTSNSDSSHSRPASSDYTLALDHD